MSLSYKIALLFTAVFAATKALGANFVVATPPCYGPPPASEPQYQTNAFVLPLIAPEDITKARILAATGRCLALGDDFRPVFEIGVGSDGTNRNVALSSQPLWSWDGGAFVGWTLIAAEGYL